MSSWKSKDFQFNLNTEFTLGFVFQSLQTFRWESAEELYLMTLKSDAKFEEKLLLSSKNDIRNLVNFNASSGKSGNLHFDVILLPNIKFQPKEYSRMISYDTAKRSKLWRKTDFLFEKWHVEFYFNLSSGKSENLHFYGKYVMFERKRCRGIVLWKMPYKFKNVISNLA